MVVAICTEHLRSGLEVTDVSPRADATVTTDAIFLVAHTLTLVGPLILAAAPPTFDVATAVALAAVRRANHCQRH